jgi:hypothetical protein
VYANAGAAGTLSGASLTAATYQNSANLGLANVLGGRDYEVT